MDDGASGLTPSQTVGPFLHLALADPALRDAVGPDEPHAIAIIGTVRDGRGDPVPDAVVETWQFGGLFTRCATAPDGSWEIRTARPPAVTTLDGTAQAPHVAVSVFARGLLDRLVTRIYFDDETANATDPTLAAAGDRSGALVARSIGPGRYHFDIRLQGEDESVFFVI